MHQVASPPVLLTAPAPRGLTQAEAALRLRAGPPEAPSASSRSYRSIVGANVFTVFNLILLVAGVATLTLGDWRDALFLGILVANTTIGITQEVRAKRALDRLAALVAPSATVLRDGRARTVAIAEVVPGDLMLLEAGDRVTADGDLVEARGLMLDEAILTGESEPVQRNVGQMIQSGSFVVDGAGSCVVRAVGSASYAQAIAGEARAFRHPRSPLELALNRLLLLLVAVMVPLAGILAVGLALRDSGPREAVATAVAGALALVPEGLLLLAGLTAAVAALRMARRGVLAQQLNAVESLASVDVICLDKTGTLTDRSLRLVDVVPAVGVPEDELREALRAYAAAWPRRDETLEALLDGAPAQSVEPRARPVLLGASLERGAGGRGDQRPGRARALRARRARREVGRGGGGGAARPRLRPHVGAARGTRGRRWRAGGGARARAGGARRAAAGGRGGDGRVSARAGRRVEGALRRCARHGRRHRRRPRDR